MTESFDSVNSRYSDDCDLALWSMSATLLRGLIKSGPTPQAWRGRRSLAPPRAIPHSVSGNCGNAADHHTNDADRSSSPADGPLPLL